MAAATIPAGPLQDASEALGRALLRAHAMGQDELTAPMRQAMSHIIDAAREQGATETKLQRANKQNDRVLEANLALSRRLMAAQMASENLVRDLAPALEQITTTFQRAITHQAALVKAPRTTHVPTGSAGRTYSPRASVSTVRVVPRSSSTATTLAAGTPRPDGSFTEP
jgi:hypothetical protein